MDLTTWLDVAIGLTLIYLGVSLFVTIINEYISQKLNMRGRDLYDDLQQLVDDPDIKQALLRYPALKPFFNDKPQETPSYIDTKVLGQLLIGSLSNADSTENSIKQIKVTIDQLPDSALKMQLQSIARTVGDKTEDMVTAVSDWMDRSLTMMGGTYKRNLQIISFCIGLALTVLFNINTITLTETIYRDKELRSAVTAYAVQVSEQTSKETFEKCSKQPELFRDDPACKHLKGLTDALQGNSDSLGKLPIGWNNVPLSFEGTAIEIIFTGLQHIAGWLLTALAISLGAPFWFDLLNKAVSVRHGMRKPQ
ncbi:MAG: hypothetical protein DYH15_06410 [Nitrosomonas sp. PRO4]|nr:hypothetical protein [Nitrosomonas sp. PRO4]